MGLSTTCRGVCIAVTVTFVGVPVLYSLYSEVQRHRLLSKRRRKYNSSRHACASSSSNENKLEGTQHDPEQADKREGDEEVEQGQDALMELYASASIAGRWANPFPEWREQVGMLDWLAWKALALLEGRLGSNPGLHLLTDEEINSWIPVSTPAWEELFGDEWREGTVEFEEEEDDDDDDVKAVWIGQSTVFVQMEHVGILTDPTFDERTIDSILAPRRLRPLPFQLESLLSIQIVLISHNHFDHLSPSAIAFLASPSYPHAVTFVVPLGLGPYIVRLGAARERVVELDWWQSQELEVDIPTKDGRTKTKKLVVSATPAMHWSARSPFDTNQSLWCSFVLKGNSTSLFHCGDSGYGEFFKAIGTLFAPITLALLPIGAYCPRWHLRSVHISPEEAVKVHLHLKAKRSIPVHWGTWCLSDEVFQDPAIRLENTCRAMGVKGFERVGMGEIVRI